MSRVRITEQVHVDVHEAILWYEEKQPGVGDRFVEEVERCYGILEKRPLSGQEVETDIRRLVMKIFPYVLIYTYHAEANLVEVFAVHHAARNPELWRNRIP